MSRGRLRSGWYPRLCRRGPRRGARPDRRPPRGRVGALAAVALRELCLRDRLAGLRTALYAQDEVLVDGTNDEDVNHEDAPLPTGCSRPLLQELGDLWVDHHVQQVGPSRVQGALEGGQEISISFDQLAFHPKPPRDADEVYPLHVETRHRVPPPMASRKPLRMEYPRLLISMNAT